MKYDVAIIGGGMAGATAALRSHELGRRAVVINKGWGATAMSSGALDFWDLTGWKNLPGQVVLNLAGNSHHPYHLLGLDVNSFSFEKLVEMGQKALDLLLPALSSAGLNLIGGLSDNLVLADETGVPRATNIAQESQASGHLLSKKGKLLVAGLSNLNCDFRHEFLAGAIRFWSRKGLLPEFDVDATEIKLDEILDSGGIISSMEAARLCDEEEIRPALLGKLKLAFEKHGATHLALPPVLGIESTSKCLSFFKNSGINAFELLAHPPSVPGHRLQAAIERALEEKGIPLLRGEVERIEAHDSKLSALYYCQGSKREVVEADSFILSSGRIAGGGFFDRGGFEEPLLNLPVFLNGREVTCTPEFPLVDGMFSRRQDVFAIGLKTDARLRPLDARNRPIYENLKSAGSIMGGSYPFGEKCGMGVTIISGYVAAQE
jgi:glycerol-3-phosphate dehydrogenase subunit B